MTAISNLVHFFFQRWSWFFPSVFILCSPLTIAVCCCRWVYWKNHSLLVSSLPCVFLGSLTRSSLSHSFASKCHLKSKVRMRVCMHAQSLQSCPTLCSPMDCTHQAALSTGFFRQEYWSGLPSPSPGDLPDPRIELASLASPALAGRFFTTSALWEAPHMPWENHNSKKTHVPQC